MQVEELNDTNCKTYLLVVGDVAALVDPVRERLETYRASLCSRGLSLRMVLETHTHADHLMLGRGALTALGAPVAMHHASPSPLVTRHVGNGEIIDLGGEPIEVFHTPGHTPDSVCYRVPGAILTGDTLFVGGSGRTDFPGGDAGAQYDAVAHRLFDLPDDTVVWPGHDYKGMKSSTIGRERATNPRFVGRSRQEYVELMANLALPVPDRVQQVLQVNQSGFEGCEVGFPPVSETWALTEIPAPDLAALLRSTSPPMLLDIREPEEFTGELGHVEGSLLIPLDSLEHRLPKLEGYVDRDVVVVCRAGPRGASAGAILARAGFRRVRNLRGGIVAWREAGFPVQR
jgi:glyoxylase-like metal-dependent hydrolase (beta-lactamase superfamily II)/rhodanese-related sulfurtransferase